MLPHNPNHREPPPPPPPTTTTTNTNHHHIMNFLFGCFSSTCKQNSSCSAQFDIPSFRVFSYDELRIATNSFRSSNKIGQGGFGCVYKGELKSGALVAIKVLSVELESLKGEREFISEIAALSHIKHENLVTLRGCCVHGAKRFLVYDYMPNNSIAHSFLCREESRSKFNWAMRREIAIGIARGLAYLHEEVEPRIIHRDIKASNILLDKDFTPKVADFGLAKLFTDNASYISTRVAGTLGYLAPEYAMSGHLSRKSDVYSFGVLLLQIATGCSVVEFSIEHWEKFLVDKVWEEYKGGDLLELIDKTLDGVFPREEGVRILKIGLLCVQETLSQRPTMSAALKMLKNEAEVPDGSIIRPGRVTNLMQLKTGQEPKHSPQSAAMTNSNSSSSTAPSLHLHSHS